MIKTIKIIATVSFAIAVLAGCKKVDGPLSDIKPAVPVTVTNAIDFRPEPTVSTPLPTTAAPVSTITITLSVAGSGRTIKEITKVAASTTYTQIQSTGTTGFYTTAPIPASGATVTFTTTTAAYAALYPGAFTVNTELSRRFYFLLTLDDNTQIVTEAVRVLVL
jgi:PBP1b-binding outer membrane lipoprotein LpoB